MTNNRTDNDLLKRQEDRAKGWTDSFGQQVSHGIRNQVDIPSHYNANPERIRYFEDGTRTQPEDSAKFTDREASFLLEPNAGDVLNVRSAERPRYVVGVDAAGSLAAQVESTLGAGDTVKIGLNDFQTPENGAFFEINGGSDNRLVLLKDGSEVDTNTFEFPDGVDETDQLRYEIRYNWYGVGTYKFIITSTDTTRPIGDGTKNTTVGELGISDGPSTNDGNFHLFHEIDATTSGQQLSVGSAGFLTYGDVSPTSRIKRSRIIGATDNYSGTGNYEPIAAIRIDPDRGNVFCQVTEIEAVPDGGDGELLAIVIPNDETDASGFATPPQHSQNNSVIEQTTTITTFPDSGGTIVTDAANPNGYQVGFYSTDVTGLGANTSRVASQGRDIRPLYEDDICVFLYKADTATARTVNLVYGTKQLW